MAAPTDEEEEEEDHVTPEEIENDFESEEEEEDDFEDDGSGDPEAGNPEEGSEEDEDEEEDEEEETNESVKVIRNRIILESFDDFEARGPIPIPPNARGDMYQDELETIELDFEGNGEEEEEEENEECFVTCKSCGSKKEIERGSYPMGVANQEDPSSWWQGAEMGMQCGCS